MAEKELRNMTKFELLNKVVAQREYIQMHKKNADHLQERNTLAGRYLQVLRAIEETIGGDVLLKQLDFDRVLDILEQDRHLEGF